MTNGFAGVLCTRLATDDQQRVTGELVSKNCYGPEKIRRIELRLAKRKSTCVTAYGDNEMLALAVHSCWVRASH